LLLADFEKNKDDWENNRLELFLEAMQAYAGSLGGYYKKAFHIVEGLFLYFVA